MSENDLHPLPEDLIRSAESLLVARQEVSVSLVQRHFKLRYSAALSLMSVLAERGVVTGPDTDGKRTLTVSYRTNQSHQQ